MVRFQLDYADGEAFVRGYAGNLSAAGMFIAAEEPPAVGTQLRFDVLLADERIILRGEGEVVWTAPSALDSAGAPEGDTALHGCGLRFLRLDAASHAVLRQVLAYQAAHPAQFFTELPDLYAPRDPQSAAASPPALPSLQAAPAGRSIAGAAKPSSFRAPDPWLQLAPTSVPVSPDEEQAALQQLLVPPPPPSPPAAADAARQLDALLQRRPL